MSLTVRIEQTQPMRLAGAFHCEAGQMIALVGPSGAGKTSLLRCIAGLMRPQQAQIQVGDALWCDTDQKLWLPPQARNVGLVFQDYALMPHMNALDNVALPLRGAHRHNRARDMLQRVGLTSEQMHRRPSDLSGGQQQRVAVARALVREPAVLLLDEPFSAVDQMARQNLYALLADLREDIHVPMVLVTHDLHEARMLADELVVMAEGEVLQQGRPDAIHRAPRNARVADMVGVANRFVGIWEGSDAARSGWGWLRWGDGAAAVRLHVRDKGRIAVGQSASWAIPGEGLTLCEPELSSDFIDETAESLLLPVRVLTLRHLGDVSLLRLECEGVSDAGAGAGAPAGVVFQMMLTGPQSRPLEPGRMLCLSLDLSLVHIMPVKTGGGALGAEALSGPSATG